MDLSKYNNKELSAYVANNRNFDKGNGELIIVHNEGLVDNRLSSEYNLYLDDKFISGGYGFPNKDNYDNIITAVSSHTDKIQALSETLSSISSELNEDEQDLQFEYVENEYNKLGIEYNKYNMMTSYIYLKQSQAISGKYELTPMKKSLNYVTNISIEAHNDSVPMSEEFAFTIHLTLKDFSDNIEEYSVHIYTNKRNSIYDDYIINNSSTIKEISVGYSTYDKEDLIFEIKKDDESIYSEIKKDFFKWKEHIYYSIANNAVNDVNFRDSGFNIESYRTQFTSFISNTLNSIKTFDKNEYFDIEFSNSSDRYDYIISNEDYNIEFYYNGLKSNNWKQESLVINTKTYYIWQSPQKYYNSHIWTLKITE